MRSATMQVRGAPLIGATAAYGVALGDRRRPVGRGARCRHLRARRNSPDRRQLALGTGRDEAVHYAELPREPPI